MISVDNLLRDILEPANGLTKIQGFGMLHWETIDIEGNIILIKVLSYYVLDISLHLLSPQDYAKYHHLKEIKDNFCSSGMNTL